MNNFDLSEIKLKGRDLAILLRDALILRGYIPPLNHEIRDTYSWRYSVEPDKEHTYVLIVERYIPEEPELPKEPYKAGDWKDPEVEEIINAE